MIKNRVLKTAAAALFLASTALQAAPDNPTLNDRFSLRLGPFFSNLDTKVKVGNEQQTFEDYLDDSETTAAIKGLWRISKHFRLDFGYWAVNRETSESSNQNANIGGINIPLGSSIGADFDTSLAGVALGWSFVANDTTEFGVNLGLAALNLRSELGASVPGRGSISFTAFDETYPQPTIGVYLNHALSPRWSLSGSFGGIAVNIGDDFEGNVVDASALLEYRPSKNIGFGIAYLYNSGDAELKDLDNIEVDWTYQGPFAYITFGFGAVQ